MQDIMIRIHAPGLATSRGPCTDGLCRHDTHADA
jgi:hypothetical protein